jgi:uncharacterized protein YjbI with pentapeptide repeats
MKKLRVNLLNFQNRIGQKYNELQIEISRKLIVFKSNLQIRYWNFKIKLPNLALTVPLIGALVLLTIGIYFLVVGFHTLHPDQPITFYTLLPDFYSNVSTTLIGISFTVLIIDWLNRIRDARLEKIRLLRDIGCGDHGIALRAVIEITEKNLHRNGFLRHRIFQGAKLAGAELINADLSYSMFHYSDFTGVCLAGTKLKMTCFWHAKLCGVDFVYADLTDADFVYADLTDARVTVQQLQLAYRLQGARLPNGKIYDGRFNLPGDIQDAQVSGVDVNNPTAMANWYAMPYEQFMNSADLREDKPEITDWDNW